MKRRVNKISPTLDWIVDNIIDVIIGIVIVIILAVCLVSCIINYNNKITTGIVVDKDYSAAHTSVRYYDDKAHTVYVPERCTLTIEGEKEGKIVQYTFEVPESEYVQYKIGDNYPHE